MFAPSFARPVLVASLLLVSACHYKAEGDDEVGDGGEDDAPGNPDDPCGACPPGGNAVDCGYLWGLGEFDHPVCGLNKDNAEYLCDSTWAGVVLASPSDNCNFPSEPWKPGVHIYEDPTNGVFVIEAELLARLEQSPQDVYLDDTRLDWNEDGDVVVLVEGALSDALGLQLDDILLDVNGHALSSVLDTARLYPSLREANQLVLTVVRDGLETKFVYEIR